FAAQGADDPGDETGPRAADVTARALSVPDDRRGLRLRHQPHQARASLEADADQRGDALPSLRVLPRAQGRHRVPHRRLRAQARGADGRDPAAEMDLLRKADGWIALALFAAGATLCAI